MNWKTGGALIGGVFSVLGGELVKISNWNESMTPLFVGALFLQLGGLAAALFGVLYMDKPGTTSSTSTTTTTGSKSIAPVALLMLALTLPFMAGCALFTKTPTTATVQQGYQQVKTAADVVASAGRIVASAQQAEIALAANPAIVPPATHKAIQRGFSATAQKVIDGLTVLRNLTSTATERQSAIQSISDSIGSLISTELAGLTPEARNTITVILNGATLVLQGALLFV